ncbi:MAG: multicopper oxidase domain-containing protein [Nocardioides sp.]|nr:multicopper oxidase domain-containing protein [Nocardioides sp.]
MVRSRTSPPSPLRRALGRLLAVGLVLALGVGGGVAALFVWSFTAADQEVRFTARNPLPIPPLAASRVVEGRRVFALEMREGSHDFGRGAGPVPTYGVNGDHLGPTVRVRDGEEIGFQVTNRLPETSTLHWHGMELPAAMDGGPHQPVHPGETWRPAWRVGQPAATLWYHPHLHGSTAAHVYRGLAGMLLVDDGEDERRGLPREYGVDDVPVVVQDKSFRPGRLHDSPAFFSSGGFLGDEVVVNGMVAPYLEATTERVRLRVLNASNARVWNLGLADGDPVTVVGTDGGLLDRPVTVDRVPLSPGERVELLVTLEPGEQVMVDSAPYRVGSDALQQRWAGGDDAFDVLELRAAARLAPAPEAAVAPPRATPVEEAGPEPARVRRFELTTPLINGRRTDMGRVDEVVTVGEAEVWEVVNRDGAPHNFHVHGVQFRVTDVDGASPPPYLRGRKDTVLLPGGTTVRLLVRFEEHTDPETPYMFHCHLLQHEDQGMMGQLVVVAEGQQAAERIEHREH